MRRKCIIVQSSTVYNRHVAIDVENYDEILSFISQDDKYREKFEYISKRILEFNWMYYDDYKKVEINDSCKGVSEMRFFPNGDNGRIYCKEVSIEGKMCCIVAIKTLPKKKSQKVTKDIQGIINSIANYEYELEE